MSNKRDALSISIIICTLDRPQKLSRCLSSVVFQMTPQDELIVVDSSPSRSAKKIVDNVKRFIRITYLSSHGGLSTSRNLGIRHAKGDVVAFTDDDCIAHSRWLGAIRNAFVSYPEVGITFGRVLPYAPKRHRGLVSMSLALIGKWRIHRKPNRTMVGIGTGNNMSIRRHLFARVGLFLPWLGAGSFCPGTEEEEFSYRCLARSIAVLEEPKIKVFHDRWMSKHDREKVLASYSCGYFAFLGFYALRGDQRAEDQLVRSIRVLTRDWLRSLTSSRKPIDYSRRLFFCAKGVSAAFSLWLAIWLRRIFFDDRHDTVEFTLP